MKYTKQKHFWQTKLVAKKDERLQRKFTQINETGRLKGREDQAKETLDFIYGFFGTTEAEIFLLTEIDRYLPQLMRLSNKDIERFINYQKSIYLEGRKPTIGRPIASQNPAYASLKEIPFAYADLLIRTWASVKENGFRMQLHNGVEKIKISAFTRQFTAYDLRMLPELLETFDKLPVMIGDAELVSHYYPNKIGFKKVGARLPQNLWTKPGEKGVNDETLQKHLTGSMFKNGKPLKAYELTLVFHGLFAIADPKTWHLPKSEQAKHMIQLCGLPTDYRKIQDLLDQLAIYIKQNKINARVVERRPIANLEELEAYRHEVLDERKLEGICIVQTAETPAGELVFNVAKNVKIKNYETLDLALLGLYLKEGTKEFKEENVSGGLLGTYDKKLRKYLPVVRVSFNPDGVQIKNTEMQERQIGLRRDIFNSVKTAEAGTVLPSLYDVYLKQVQDKLSESLGKCSFLSTMLQELPYGKDLLGLYEIYKNDPERYAVEIKKPKVADKFISKYLPFFQRLDGLEKNTLQEVLALLALTKKIKTTSRNLVKPNIILDQGEPLILETNVFNIDLTANAMPAGFNINDSEFKSLNLSNVFVERIRPEKNTTTDPETILKIAVINDAQ